MKKVGVFPTFFVISSDIRIKNKKTGIRFYARFFKDCAISNADLYSGLLNLRICSRFNY